MQYIIHSKYLDDVWENDSLYLEHQVSIEDSLVCDLPVANCVTTGKSNHIYLR